MNRKQRFIDALNELPDTATLDDIEDRFWFLMKIERGLAEIEAGHGIPRKRSRNTSRNGMGFLFMSTKSLVLTDLEPILSLARRRGAAQAFHVESVETPVRFEADVQ